MTTTSTALWVEADATITSESNWIEIESETVELTLWFPDGDRQKTSEAVDKIDKLNSALLDVRKRLMASLDSRTFSEAPVSDEEVVRVMGPGA